MTPRVPTVAGRTRAGRALWLGGLAALALGLGACGSSPSPARSGSPPSTPTMPAQAGPQAVAAVDILLDLQSNAPPLQERLSRVQDGAQIAHAVNAELANLQFVGVTGVAVAGASPLTSSQCEAVHVSAACLSVRYTFVAPHVSAGPQRAYVVESGDNFVVIRRSACDLAQPVSGTTRLATPRHAAC